MFLFELPALNISLCSGYLVDITLQFKWYITIIPIIMNNNNYYY